MRRQLYLFVKRLIDVIAAGLGVIVLSPLLVIIAVAIKLDSRGPVLYRGIRIGKHGRKFRILKFRTMVPDAERIGGTATAHRDSRITRIGHFLRHFKLDELPQLFNVLKGEMTLVGPRPEVEEHTAEYNAEEQVILTVTPGITDYSSIRFIDLNQLLGSQDPNRVFIEKYRSEKNRLRIQYVQTQSLMTDLKILITTLSRVFVRSRHGA
jgi:lipopolysaccharide/colanic/teichoic acid biosynthesis glycosyltransferase